MKKVFVLLLLSLVMTSCEDVITIDLPESESRLVIDASINWQKNTNGKEQEIKLSLSTPFYQEDVVPATGAKIQIIDSLRNTFEFEEYKETGIYKCYNFEPVLNRTYTLFINYKNETYTAKERLIPVTQLNKITQRNNEGINKNEIFVNAFCPDPPKSRNYYQFEFYLNKAFNYPTTNVYSDKYNNNEINAFYTNGKLKTGDVIDIKNYGISKQYYDFMGLLLEQGNETSGGPFQTQPATVKGNCINKTNPKNFPYGYFRLSEVSVYSYTLKDKDYKEEKK